MLGELIQNIFLNSQPPIILVLIVYVYLLYVIFFKKGKFVLIENVEEFGKLLLLFSGFFILIYSIITGIIFLMHVLFAIQLPTTLDTDISSLLFVLIFFTFYPYLLKKDAEKHNKKFDLGDWISFILIINSLLLVFALINSLYTIIFVSSGIAGYFFGLSIFLAICFLVNFVYLKIVLTKIFHLRRTPFSIKRTIKLIIYEAVISIIALASYLLIPH